MNTLWTWSASGNGSRQRRRQGRLLWRKFSNVLPFEFRRLVNALVFVLRIARKTLMDCFVQCFVYNLFDAKKKKKMASFTINYKVQVQSNFVTSEGSWKSAASHTEYQCKGRQLHSDSKIVIFWNRKKDPKTLKIQLVLLGEITNITYVIELPSIYW